MKCEECGKEFCETKSDGSELWDRGDGVMYGTYSCWTDYTCPHCGFKNQSPYRMIYST